MLEKIDHIGIAVKSLDDALKFYGVMGAGADHAES